MTTTPSSNAGSTDSTPPIHAVLVPGFWLGAWAWDEVVPALRAGGVTPHPVTLPGLDGTDTDGVTLVDHVDAVLALIGDLVGDVVLVGHSGGGAVVQGVIDRQPARVRRVIYVDSGPLRNGVALIPNADRDVPLPTWEELAAQRTSVEGMSDAALDRFRERAVDEPVGVATAVIRLTDEQRHDVPVSVVCTSFGSEMLVGMIEAGEIPSELESVEDVRYIDLPTGHWPMFSRPADLAAVLLEEILR